ncbi:MAG: GNAT family N-acetyltransferase [Halomonadaceae bacterium]|nr:MAG: GNAT family N-acetyltransferase [Halomonadaceae bacterium]
MQSVRYLPQHQSAIEGLLDDVPFKSSIWQWQFEAMAGDEGFDPVVIEKDGRIIGFNGVIPADVLYRGESVAALWSCDFYVDVTCRGQGVGRFIKQTLVKKSPLIMTFGVSEAAAQVLKRIGWVQATDVYHYRYTRLWRKPRYLAMQLLQRFNLLRGLWRRAVPFDCNLQWTESLPEAVEVDALWQRVEAGYQKVVRRNYRYLNWRYQQHPLASYRFLCARDSNRGELLGMLVVREHHGIVRLVDWVGALKDEVLPRAMIRDCLFHYRAAHQFTATTTSATGFSQALTDLGFFPSRTRPAFFVTSCLPQDQDPAQGWFLTAGDSDGEFLQAARNHYQATGMGKGEYANS